MRRTGCSWPAKKCSRINSTRSPAACPGASEKFRPTGGRAKRCCRSARSASRKDVGCGARGIQEGLGDDVHSRQTPGAALPGGRDAYRKNHFDRLNDARSAYARVTAAEPPSPLFPEALHGTCQAGRPFMIPGPFSSSSDCAAFPDVLSPAVVDIPGVRDEATLAVRRHVLHNACERRVVNLRGFLLSG